MTAFEAFSSKGSVRVLKKLPKLATRVSRFPKLACFTNSSKPLRSLEIKMGAK
jgi:hypothetical protein